MRSLRGVSLALASLLASLTAALPAVAQAPGSGTVLHVSPYVGYMVFGDYLSGPLGTTLSNAPAMMYGTQVNLSLAPQLSLVGNLGYTASDIKVGIPILGGVSVGHSSMLIYDAGLEYNLGAATEKSLPIAPFIQAGVGAIRYEINESVISTQATNLAGNVGVGADYTLSRGIALRFLAKDYIGKFNFKDATGLGISGNTAHNWAFSAGLRFDF
jgi:Outer membrane protein beta-barrel domain